MPITFSEHLIADKYGYTFGLAAVDIDGDGDLDLTNPDIQNKSTSTLHWFDNNGDGEFTRRVIHDGEPGWFERHAIGDINGDGLPDVAIVNNQKGQVVWFANHEKPAEHKWQRYVITLECPAAYDVALGDFDGDGDLDAATAGFSSNLVTWYENPGNAEPNEAWTRRVFDENMPEARTMRGADINGDGKIDLLATAVRRDGDSINAQISQVVWYENSGELPAKPWIKHIIDYEHSAAVHGNPVDLDGDGDLDVVMAHGMRVDVEPDIERHEIVWYEQRADGDQIVWTRHRVGPLPYAFEANAADLDDDGDRDIIATSWSVGDSVVWFENTGDAAGEWTMHLLKDDFHAANQIIAADLNGDEKLDIAATSDDGSRRVQGSLEMRWWRNEGRGEK
ncbi:MAG: VCBS repeat-containing protein [Planctomycetaceae bacterium]